MNERRSVDRWVEYLREHPECTSKLFIDSGAFSAHTKGKVVDVDEYIRYINSIDDQVTVFAQVDKIPGKFGEEHTKEELEEAPELSWQNYLYMVDKVKSRDKLIPIFHQGEDFRWLKNMLEYRHSDGSHIAYIGISSTNDQPTISKIQWFDKCFKMIKESSNPDVKTHAFGMTIRPVLEAFPFTSADSTGWLMCGANGSIYVGYNIVVIGDRSQSKSVNIINKSTGVKQSVRDYVEKFGYNIDDLIADVNQRQLFNIEVLKDWADHYVCKYKNVHVDSLFD